MSLGPVTGNWTGDRCRGCRKLRAENERLTNLGLYLEQENERLTIERKSYAEVAEAATYSIERYRAALEKHGRHSPDCPRFSATFYGQESDEFPVPGVKCTCGLTDALGGE